MINSKCLIIWINNKSLLSKWMELTVGMELLYRIPKNLAQ